MEQLVKNLTQKNEDLAMQSAREILDSANVQAFEKLSEKSEFLFEKLAKTRSCVCILIGTPARDVFHMSEVISSVKHLYLKRRKRGKIFGLVKPFFVLSRIFGYNELTLSALKRKLEHFKALIFAFFIFHGSILL